jgi:hypothetical protein
MFEAGQSNYLQQRMKDVVNADIEKKKKMVIN